MTPEHDRSLDPEANAGGPMVGEAESDPQLNREPMDVSDEPAPDADTPARHEMPMATDDPTVMRDDPTAMQDVRGDADDTSGMAHYRVRFDELQAMFIEEPRDAVRSAQTLVEEAVNRMMEGLRRTEVGDGADTEELRVAMKRYRDLLYQVTETDSAEAAPHVHQPAS